jgi:hypothetical protein
MPQGDNNQALLENTYRSSFGLQSENFNVTSADFTNKNVCAIQILSETATINSLTENGVEDTSYADIPYGQFGIIYGNFTAGSINSGTVRCYSFNPVIS